MNSTKEKIPSLGIAADHEGFELKKYLLKTLLEKEYKVIDFGNYELNPVDDYPDYILPLAQAVNSGDITRGIAICGSGVGACIAANKVQGVRACLISETFAAQQGVEDDDMNVICLGARVITQKLAQELVSVFLSAKFINVERHTRRLAKLDRLIPQGYAAQNIQKLK